MSLEASLAAARQGDNPHNEASSLLAIGLTLLMLRRPADAMPRLNEGLEVATELGDDELLKHLRAAATVALAQTSSKGDAPP